MRKSKYVGKQFEGNWTCTAIGIARVQSRRTKSGKIAKRPGHQTYYYVFERRTSDNKADKIIRLSSKEAAQVYQNRELVEHILDIRESKPSKNATKSVTYHFDTTL